MQFVTFKYDFWIQIFWCNFDATFIDRKWFWMDFYYKIFQSVDLFAYFSIFLSPNFKINLKSIKNYLKINNKFSQLSQIYIQWWNLTQNFRKIWEFYQKSNYYLRILFKLSNWYFLVIHFIKIFGFKNWVTNCKIHF